MPPVLHRQAAPRRQRRPSRALPAPVRRTQEEVTAIGLDTERRGPLLAAKLRALVGNATDGDGGGGRPLSFPGGAALVDDGRAWVLVDEQPARALGSALALARQAGAAGVDVVVDDAAAAGLLARRAEAFDRRPRVWLVDGTSLAEATPDPLPDEPPLDPRLAPYADVLLAAGADPVVEHGRLVGEVAGLEVARVEVHDDGPVLEVGVGRFDREAHALASEGGPSEATLRRVVELVRRHRRADAPHHPLNRLARERWLRSQVVAHPELVGADHLAPVPPFLSAPDLRTATPAPAAGIDHHDRPVVVVCSVGVDLDLVPTATDIRRRDGRGARLVLAVPPRDVHPVTVALGAALVEPAEVVAVEPVAR